jgi:hypothetical protein
MINLPIWVWLAKHRHYTHNSRRGEQTAQTCANACLHQQWRMGIGRLDIIRSMKRAVAAPILFLVWLSNGALGQVVVVGPHGKSGPPPPTSEYCSQVEAIQPNLKLTADTRIRGKVTDQTTAPFRNSPIELRRFVSQAKQVTEKKASTDSEGKFDLGVVKRGEYRLLLSPHRGFKQPEKLECSSRECTLDSVLTVNPSDQLAANCPIR